MSEPALEAAGRTLAELVAQVEELREEVAALEEALALAQQRLAATPSSTQLVEANSNLVIAALNAEALAESAVMDIGRLTLSAQRDLLTDTPNRALMFDRIERALGLATRRQAKVGVLFVDLDHFKEINDTFGHLVGDEVLKVVARRLESAVRSSDTVSRHGGDEFLVLLPELKEARDVGRIVDTMLHTISAPCRVGSHDLQISASIGIAVYPHDGADRQTLISQADAAMYRAKARRGGGFEFFSATAGINS